MNEELQKAIADMFNSVLSAKDFLVGELPEYVNQLLMWRMVWSIGFFVIGLALILSAICLQAWIYKSYKNKGAIYSIVSEDAEFWPAIIIIDFILSVTAFIFGVSIISMEWLQIWIAPKVWLVEYAASLVK